MKLILAAADLAACHSSAVPDLVGYLLPAGMIVLGITSEGLLPR